MYQWGVFLKDVLLGSKSTRPLGQLVLMSTCPVPICIGGVTCFGQRLGIVKGNSLPVFNIL